MANEHPESLSILFTCMSCSIAFVSAEEQRVHYRSDHHRYNMKRRVASLPPLNAAIFNQKVLERRAETVVVASDKGSSCEVCKKAYTTENAYRSHVNSKKHKENEQKAAIASKMSPGLYPPETATAPPLLSVPPTSTPVDPHLVVAVSSHTENSDLIIDGEASEDQINETIDEKIASARSRLSSAHCLFCTEVSSSFEINLTHMSTTHSFFIPDAEYLIDIAGLISYLGEKIAVGNICIYCNDKGKAFRTLEAVRKHMADKSHCKIAYDSQNDRLEISDYYDFTTSYPPDPPQKEYKHKVDDPGAADDDWEDVNEDEASAIEVAQDFSDDSSNLDEGQITYGDSDLELVLPSGARIGHRSMRRYYAQRVPAVPRGGKAEDPNSGAALVRRLLADKNSALVPRKGGFGAFGIGTEVVRARNRGEAREAGRHVREFRDQKRREDFMTKVGFIHNSQKHFRDQLLQ